MSNSFKKVNLLIKMYLILLMKNWYWFMNMFKSLEKVEIWNLKLINKNKQLMLIKIKNRWWNKDRFNKWIFKNEKIKKFKKFRN